MFLQNIKFTPSPSQEYVCNNLSKLLENNKCVIVNDEIGTGKTVSLLLWIYKQKSQTLPHKTKIIASNSIIYQWRDDLDKYFSKLLNYKIITVYDQSNDDLFSYDLIVCNHITSQIMYKNDFICYDEFSSINRMTIGNNNIRKSILISSDDEITKTSDVITFFRLIKVDIADGPNINVSDLPSIKTINMNMNTFDQPNIFNYVYKISAASKSAIKFSSLHIQKIIKENDVGHAIEILISDLKSKGLEIEVPCFQNDILTVIKLIKITEMEQLITDMKDTTLNNEEKYEIEKKIKIIEIQIKELAQRYDDIISGECNICCGQLVNPIFYNCCQNVICESCKKSLKNCPYCRSSSSELISSNLIKPEKSVNLLNLSNTLLSILQGANYSIIFRYTINSMNLDINKKFRVLKGTAEQRMEIIEDYKIGNTKILFLDFIDDFSGLRLENTTDIIFLDKPCEKVEKQIIGRALRLGRDKTLPLNLHYLSCD
uniref:RING-type domain-containing protein n=1 Tax=viral metagenome TaxID=1070528 RepID=A0A6C0JBG7_9ZZZZ